MNDFSSDRGNAGQAEDPEAAEKRELAHKMGTAGWALFFIWVGIAFLLNVDIGVGLLGIGLITLVMQVLRGINRLKLEWFWIVVGVLFLAGGIWELAEPRIPVVPVLLILAGVLLLLSISRSRGHAR